MTSRQLYSQKDLPELKKLNRQQMLQVLGSFDDRNLSPDEFVWRTVELLDPARVPGLAEAQAAHNVEQALAAILKTCVSHQTPAKPQPLSADELRLADNALVNRFSFYNEEHQLAADFDWDANPGTGHWGHDLNRFTFLQSLTNAFLATNDTRYSRKILALILDWIAKCDFGLSAQASRYAFGSYLNQGMHLVIWGQAVGQLLLRQQVPPRDLVRILKSVQEHLAYLELYTNGHTGNWPTFGCSGLLCGLARFPIFRETDRFISYCRQAISTQIRDQVLPDGVHDELTPHYHHCVLENLFGVRRSLLDLGSDLDATTLQTIRKMVHYRQQTFMPDGSRQLAFNDSDPDWVADLKGELTAVGLADYLRPTAELGPEVYPWAGVAFLRQQATQGDLYLAFDAGLCGRMGHQQEDRLGFWLFAYGRSFIVDPGRHLYDGSPASYYNFLRSTRAHSTIMVDGLGQNSGGVVEGRRPRQPLELGWQVTPTEIRASGLYDLGYGPGNFVKVTHRREVVFVKERCWVVFDTVTGAGPHHIDSRFQFAPGPLQRTGSRAHTGFADANLLLHMVSTQPINTITIEEGQENPRGGWYSDGYNKIAPAPALVFSMDQPLPLRMATLLYPYRGAHEPVASIKFDGQTAILRSDELGEVSVVTTLK